VLFGPRPVATDQVTERMGWLLVQCTHRRRLGQPADPDAPPQFPSIVIAGLDPATQWRSGSIRPTELDTFLDFVRGGGSDRW